MLPGTTVSGADAHRVPRAVHRAAAHGVVPLHPPLAAGPGRAGRRPAQLRLPTSADAEPAAAVPAGAPGVDGNARGVVPARRAGSAARHRQAAGTRRPSSTSSGRGGGAGWARTDPRHTARRRESHAGIRGCADHGNQGRGHRIRWPGCSVRGRGRCTGAGPGRSGDRGEGRGNQSVRLQDHLGDVGGRPGPAAAAGGSRGRRGGDRRRIGRRRTSGADRRRRRGGGAIRWTAGTPRTSSRPRTWSCRNRRPRLGGRRIDPRGGRDRRARAAGGGGEARGDPARARRGGRRRPDRGAARRAGRRAGDRDGPRVEPRPTAQLRRRSR